MSERKHSPLPWTVSGVRANRDGQTFLRVLCGDDQDWNISVHYSDRTPEMHVQSHADAAFIVRACNSHYELVEALENINRLFDSYGKHRLPEYVRKEFAQVRTVLAKARGEQ